LIVGDKKFAGLEWVKFLKVSCTSFCMCLPKHHTITLKNSKVFTINELLAGMEIDAFQEYMIDGIRCNVMMRCLTDQAYLFLTGSFLLK
jgi:hypothetical protein